MDQQCSATVKHIKCSRYLSNISWCINADLNTLQVILENVCPVNHLNMLLKVLALLCIY